MKFMIITTVALSLFVISPLYAEVITGKNGNNSAGIAIDLLPSILSGAEEKPGYSFQVWTGIERIKIRFVAAHLYQPDSLIDESFTNYEMNVTAFIMDYFFSDNFSGLWIGTGAELWNCSIEHKTSGSATSWTDNILTLGAGYVWKLTESVYLDPFAAVHYRMNDSKVVAGGSEFSRQRVSASASVKIGYMFNL